MRKLLQSILRVDMALGVLLCAGLLIAVWTQSRGATANAGWLTFRDQKLGYSISYPKGWTIDKKYVYAGFGPDHEIQGVAFHIPASMARGTNLSDNLTEVSLESVDGAGRCDAARFLPDPQNVHSIVENGMTYSTATSEDAGAGNFYDETIFALVGSSPCVAIRYFVHSTNFDNYDPGTVQKFDAALLESKFDRIRWTLTVLPAVPR